jgi:hypothetical protein
MIFSKLIKEFLLYFFPKKLVDKKYHTMYHVLFQETSQFLIIRIQWLQKFNVVPLNRKSAIIVMRIVTLEI